MTLGVPLVCFVCFLAFSSLAIFAPRRVPAAARLPAERIAVAVAAAAPVVAWPAHLDIRAAGADPAVRLALARELGACRGRWALDTVLAAIAEEPDPVVTAALAEALASLRAAAAQA